MPPFLAMTDAVSESNASDPLEPSAPPRALWQWAVGSFSQAIRSADAVEPLESQIARSVMLHDTPLFDSILPRLRESLSSEPPAALAQAISEATARAMAPKKIYYFQRLLDAGANPDAPLPSSFGSPNGRSLIHHAAELGPSAALSLLIQHSARLDPQDDHGIVPLMLAAKAGSLERVDLLLEAGARLDPAPSQSPCALTLSIGNFPYADPYITVSPSADIQLDCLAEFTRPLLTRARIAISLLNAGAPIEDPTELLAFCARIRDHRLLAALAQRGFCSKLIELSELTGSALPSVPSGHSPFWQRKKNDKTVDLPQWAAYLQAISQSDPQIEVFLDFALEEEIARQSQLANAETPFESAPASTRPEPPPLSAAPVTSFPTQADDVAPPAKNAPRAPARKILFNRS